MTRAAIIKSIGVIVCVVQWCLASLTMADESVGIIAHPAVSESSLSLKELRAIFTMKRTLWGSGESIQVFVLENDNALHKSFSMGVLGVFPRQLESVWYRLVFSGTGSAPVKVENKAKLLKLIAETPGAIGYFNKKQINEHVKVIQIEP